VLNESEQLIAYVEPSLRHTDDDKFDVIIAFLTEDHLDVFGGYPHDWAEVAGKVIVADLDDRKDRQRTELLIYDRRTLIEWYDDAVRWLAQETADRETTYDRAPDLEEALHETRPDEDGDDGGGGEDDEDDLA
jgi:hypothetical protein